MSSHGLHNGLNRGRAMSRLGQSSKQHSDPLEIRHGKLSLAFNRAITIPNPSYVQILKKGILSVTSFSLLRKGGITEYDISDVDSKALSPRELRGDYLWPNELSRYMDYNKNPVLLVPDGFLTPGQNDGGVFTITNPEMPSVKPKRITHHKPGWFYHKAVYLELPIMSGDGVEDRGGKMVRGVLTARAYKPVLGRGQGELVWLKLPEEGEGSDEPWEEVVLA